MLSVGGIDHKIQEAVEELSATSCFNLIKNMTTIVQEENKKEIGGVRNSFPLWLQHSRIVTNGQTWVLGKGCSLLY